MKYGIDDFVKRAINYLADQNHWTIIAMEAGKDHIHILLEYDTTECICDIINTLKRQTTHYLWIHYKTYLINTILEETHFLVKQIFYL